MPRPLPESLTISWSDPVTGETRSRRLDGAVRIGSNRQENDVVLGTPGVEPLHAEILADGGGWELVSLGLRRLKVDDAMHLRARLSSGSTFSIGPVVFRVLRDETNGRRPSSGSHPAFDAPAPPPRRSVGPAIAGLLLVLATGAAAWMSLRDEAAGRPEGGPPRARLRPSPQAPPPAKSPAGAAALAAGSLARAPLAGVAQPASATVVVRRAGTSFTLRGFFVSASGQLVTNHRLVAGADSVEVLAPGFAAPVPARLVAGDPARDLALLQADVLPPVPVAPLDDENVMREPEFALGASGADVRAFVGAHR